MYALLSCTAALVPERVIEADAGAELFYGEADQRFGADVEGAADWTAYAASDRTWYRRGEILGAYDFAGWWGDRFVTVEEGEWAVDGVPQGVIPATRWAAGEAGVYAVEGGGLVRAETGDRVEFAAIDLAVGVEVHVTDGVVARTYSPALELVDEWSGSSVGEWRGVGWAGEPDAGEGGRVCTAAGTCIEGEPGDQLGLTIGGGAAAGTFNKWIVPPRARIVPLDGGTAWAMERGAENQAIVLAGDDSTLVVGAPYYPHGGGPAGLVAVVPR